MEGARTTIQVLADLLLLVSAGSLGVFAGTMLTEGLVLVPYWRSLAPADFFSWYRANDERLLGFFGPVTGLAAGSALAAAAASFWAVHPGRWLALLAAILSVAFVAMFPLYFQGANARFSAASVPAERLPAELSRWADRHRLRTMFALAAVVATLLASWSRS